MAIITKDRVATYQSYDYTTYKTETPILNQIIPMTGVLSGQVRPANVIGDGVTAISGLLFLDVIEVITASNVDLKDLRVTGNKIKIFNSGSSTITVQTGITGSLTYENINPKDTVNCFFDGTYWRVVDGCTIGDIKPVHADFNSGSIDTPWGWELCDGSTISDPESVFNGATIPDLNGDGRFLRAGDTSGTIQADAFQGFDLNLDTGGSGVNITGLEGVGSAGNLRASSGPGAGATFKTTFIDDGTNGTPRTASETRPVNMSVVMMIKVK